MTTAYLQSARRSPEPYMAHIPQLKATFALLSIFIAIMVVRLLMVSPMMSDPHPRDILGAASTDIVMAALASSSLVRRLDVLIARDVDQWMWPEEAEGGNRRHCRPGGNIKEERRGGRS